MNLESTISEHTVRTLREIGWVKLTSDCHSESALVARTLSLASDLGVPRRGRSVHVVEALRPKNPEDAPPASLSRRFGFGAFPYHIDTAHWPVPARFLIMSCVSPGESAAPTLLAHRDAIPVSDEERSIAISGVFLVKNGRSSFYSSILGIDREFIRHDPGCMEPQNPDAVRALEIFSSERVQECAHAINWQPGDSVIIDNWRVLHARAALNNGSSRLLLRCLVS